MHVPKLSQGDIKLKITHINLAKGFRGGERQTQLLVEKLAGKIGKQTLICPKNSELAKRVTGENTQIESISRPYLFFLKKCLNSDLLHAHDAKAAHFALLAHKRYGIPYLITRRVPNKPKNNSFTRAIYANTSVSVALSGAISNVLKNRFGDINTTIIPSMKSRLTTDESNIQHLKSNFEGKFVVGHVGALVKHHKGQQHIINIATKLEKIHPDILFVLVGNGADEQELKQQANGLSNVAFTGFINNVGDYMAAFDMFIFPSLEEGLGSILLDAMDFSLPIVANNVDGIPDIVKNEQNGLLVEPKNDHQLEQAVLRLYNDRKLATQLGSAGKIISDEYLPETISNKYISLYETILSQ